MIKLPTENSEKVNLAWGEMSKTKELVGRQGGREAMRQLMYSLWEHLVFLRWRILKLVNNEEIEAALLVVKSEVYDEIVFVFEVCDHIIIETDQQALPGFLQYLLDHFSGYIVFLSHLEDQN